MSKYYCHKCAIELNHIQPLIQNDFSGSIGCDRYEKFIKHTFPIELENGLHSVFESPEYEKYKDYIVNTHASGSLEINGWQKNIVWYAGKETCVTFLNKEFLMPVDAVKLVLHTNINPT